MDNFKFMDSWPAWVRWVAVLPASLLAVALCALAEAVIYTVLARAGKPDSLVPLTVVALFFCGALFVWTGAATAPRFKLGVAFVLAGVPLWLAYRDYAVRTAGLHAIGPYVWQAKDVFSYLLNAAIALILGVVVGLGLTMWGALRRRTGLASR